MITELAVGRLEQLEVVIERGLNTFVEVGQALMDIRDGRLYRQGYATFEDYCRERWGWERRHAYRLMDAASAVENVSRGTQNMPLPTSERQVRPLTQLEPTQQRETWARVVETAPEGKVTAAHVQAVVDEIAHPVIQESKMGVHFSSETDEWYTPPEIISRVQILFPIDLDPCSNPNKSVPALRHFTKGDNGLSRVWGGRVYMNPPYGREIVDWVMKLCEEHEVGNVSEAIALVPARTDTEWFGQFRNYAICFIHGRLRFSGMDNSAPFPSAAVYLGGRLQAFHEAFSEIGDIWVRWQMD